MIPITKEQYDEFEQAMKDSVRFAVLNVNEINFMDDYAVADMFISSLKTKGFVICKINSNA